MPPTPPCERSMQDTILSCSPKVAAPSCLTFVLYGVADLQKRFFKDCP